MKLISTHSRTLWICYNFLCSIFSKRTQKFDFIKRNLFQKLAYNVKYISQINGDLIMFFGNSRIRSF